MKKKRAQWFLHFVGPRRGSAHDPEMSAAMRMIESDGELAQALEAQQAFDHGVFAELSIPVPEDVEQHLVAFAQEAHAAPKKVARRWYREPAVLAVSFAFVVMLGFIGWLLLERQGTFPGMDVVTRLVEQGAKATIGQYEEYDGSADTVGDWFLLKGFDRFVLPPAFKKFRVVGTRLFEFESEPVAAMAVLDGEQRMFFYVLRGKPLGIEPPEDGKWQIWMHPDQKNLSIATAQIRDVCFVVAVRGDRAVLEEIVNR